MRVIFVCTGNTCRSPMAEKIFANMLGGEDVEIVSRGVMCVEGQPMNINARLVMKDMGLDTSHRSQSLTKDDIDTADYVITMTAAHAEYIASIFGECDKVHPLSYYTDKGDVLDPYGGDVFEYNRCARKLVSDLALLRQKLF